MIANENKLFFNPKAILIQIDTWGGSLNNNTKNWFCLGGPLLVSLLVKMVLLFLLHDGTINDDGALYIRSAIQFAEGNFSNGLALYPMPTYPLLLTVTHRLIPDWILTGYMISTISLVLVTIPLFYLTKYMFGMKSAFWACLVFAFLPEMNKWALYISRDALFLLLFSWCVYFALRSIRETGSFFFWITFIIAWISILVRIEGTAFIFFFSGALIYLGFTNRKEKIRYFSRALIWIGTPTCIAFLAFFLFGHSGITVNRFDQVFSELGKMLNGDFLDRYFQIYQFFSEAEKNPPFSKWHYNFAALARHYLLIIYSMGIVEVLMKTIFPLSCIPLYIGLKKQMPSAGKFIICFCFVFIGVVYYKLLTQDFLTTRFLMIPAFLLLPWVGTGIDELYKKINNSSRKVLLSLLIMTLIMAPAIKSFDRISSNDNATPLAVKWLANNNMLNNNTITTNDKKISFYIELEKKEKKYDIKIHYSDDPSGSEKIEKIAFRNNADILIINLHTKETKRIPDYKLFIKIHTILGNRDIVQIYRRNNILRTQGSL